MHSGLRKGCTQMHTGCIHDAHRMHTDARGMHAGCTLNACRSMSERMHCRCMCTCILASTQTECTRMHVGFKEKRELVRLHSGASDVNLQRIYMNPSRICTPTDRSSSTSMSSRCTRMHVSARECTLIHNKCNPRIKVNADGMQCKCTPMHK